MEQLQSVDQSSSSTGLEEVQSTMIKNNQQTIFADDVCFEIISMFDDSWFILQTCALISKQFFNVIKERAKLVIKLKKNLSKELISQLRKSQFINNIVNIDDVKIDYGIYTKEKKVGANNVVVYIKTDRTDFEGLKLICEMKQLTSLNISHNQILIGAEGAKLISQTLPRLTSLNVTGNELGAEGAKYISELKQLTCLKIDWNQIGSEGAKALRELQHLTSLDINYNRIGSEGAKFINEIPQLTSLSITHNDIGNEGAKSISEMKQLTTLNVDNNEIGDEGVEFLSEMSQLRSLSIYCNGVGNEGAKFICKMKQLTELGFSRNQVNSEGIKLIRRGMTHLKALNVG